MQKNGAVPAFVQIHKFDLYLFYRIWLGLTTKKSLFRFGISVVKIRQNVGLIPSAYAKHIPAAKLRRVC